jgi:predicted dehydrogenase
MNPNSPHPVRVALIGVSGYGRIHLQLIRECRERGEVRFVAAVVINPAEEAATLTELNAYGCKIYPDCETMLAAEHGRIDLCMIPTGIHWHADMTIAALRAGMNVLVEKPLAASMPDVEAVRAAERASGKFVAVGFQDYYESGTQWLKGRIQAGAIGTLQSVRFLGIWPRPRSYYLRNNWAGRLRVDGRTVMDSPLNNAFAHFAMLGLYFAGVGRDVAAAAQVEAAELYRTHAIESFDTAVVRLRTAAGVKIWFGVSHVCHPQFEPEIRLQGSEGTASWNYEKEAWIDHRAAGREHQVVADITQARREMMAAVLARLRGEAVTVCSPEIARHHVQFIADLHADWPIVPIAPDLIQWVQPSLSPEAAVPIVAGLEDAMHRAYTNQSSLAAAGFNPPAPANQ